ncbi:MAG: YbjN domain-containing protein, partial [Bryobacterales bacterium]|nr:YbjN domain-containing protein [Bryobacterales bacterium]
MDATLLENYITRYGWTFERYDEALVAGVSTDAGDILVAFQLAPPWLRLSAPALAAGSGRETECYTKLLELNERSRLVRFALGEAGAVMLCT